MPQIQILPENPGRWGSLAQALGKLGGAYAGNKYVQSQNEQKKQQEASVLKQALDEAQKVFADPNLSQEEKQIRLQQTLVSRPDVAQSLGKILQDTYKTSQTQMQKKSVSDRKQASLDRLTGSSLQNAFTDSNQLPQQQNGQQLNPENYRDEDIAALAIDDPQAARVFQQQKNAAVKAKADKASRDFEELKYKESKEEKSEKKKREEFLEERSHHSKIVDPIMEENRKFKETYHEQKGNVQTLKNILPDVGTQDYIADVFNLNPLRTAKGAQAKSILKNYLLNDIQKITGQKNQWIEKQIASAQPQLGLSPEANMILAEAYDSKIDINKRMSEYIDKLSQQDMDNFGYEKRDIKDRAIEMTKPYAEKREKLSKYRMQEMYEQQDPKKLESLDNVEPGTPLTLKKGEYLYGLYGDQFEEVARKLGYEIPEAEIFKGEFK